ncbi:MAG: ArsR family transcriptional regulator [Caldisericaceae bacterium]
MIRYETILKAIADEKRFKLISLIIKENSEFYVCELTDALGESQYNISKYLKEFKVANLVKIRRVGKGILYSPIEPEEDFLKLLFKAIQSIPDDYIKKERELLKLRVNLRKDNKCIAKIQNQNWKEEIEKNKTN